MNNTLEAKGVTIWRGETLLLDAVDLTVGPGEVLQLAGANGSGKTTLLGALCGLAELDEGEVHWNGKLLHKDRAAFADALLYLGHRPGISGGLTPVENLELFCALNGGDAANIESVLDELSLGLQSMLPCRVLSAGQQRRVALARLRLQQRKLWILDEPLTSLDTAGLDWVRTRIAEQAAANGSVIFTTHQVLNLDSVPIQTLHLEASA
ncbi:MAG: cytochrome c biogenesis heme-transporting ATPase CcmA [Granulosicoccus sp.]